MKHYYVEGAGWFVVRAVNKKRARSVGVAEFGAGRTRLVREATDAELKDYVSQKGVKALIDT